MHFEKCKTCLNRVALVGIYANLLMVILKVFIGITSGSKSCIADGLHSASNIVTAVAIMFSQRFISKKRSDEYQYGYGKAEFISAGFISLLIIGGAIFLISASIKHLMTETSTPPHSSAILMAILSICMNEMLFRYMRCVGTQFKSQTILANAWANRADCFSSMAVIIGVIGSRMGFHHLDPVAALFVVAIIIKVSISILVESIKALMDHTVNDVYEEEINSIVKGMEDVQDVADIKTRHIGQKIWAELDIMVDPKCTIHEGQMIAENVRNILVGRIMDLEKVLVHFKPLQKA
uniref:Magnetosome protein MamM n=1 Tax=Candidatus Magnetananas rongchengensis TaxID=1463558 RepID=A0A3Q8B4P4_9BACT|nr:magnetosome protein MamM [Candidatus Magnetananas rongchenensis]